ncbi:hypothetical protein E05_48940 [Plautia stali symbiont]|nr:hypothetical protein E05_48940 [Plautia stali symbiont]
MRYAHPGTPGALVSFQATYANYIAGNFTEPLSGQYFMNTSPVDGSDIARFPRSDARDIDLALDAAHQAADAWGKTQRTAARQPAVAGGRSYGSQSRKAGGSGELG